MLPGPHSGDLRKPESSFLGMGQTGLGLPLSLRYVVRGGVWGTVSFESH